MDRHSYTPEGFAEMKWELTKACIDRAIKDAVFATGPDRCFHGSPDSGYWFALDHARGVPHQPDLVPEDLRPAMGHYRLPAITRGRASVEPAVLGDYLGDPTQTFDPWGAGGGEGFHPQGLYATWADGVDQVFESWDQMPDERDFWAAATALREAVDPLSEPTKRGGTLFDLEWNLGIPSATYDPGSAGPPAPMQGQVIEVLTHYYVIPLGGTLVQQHWLGTLAAAELEGLGNMWQTARRCVMEIGRIATDTMRGHGTVEDALANLSVIGSVMTVVSLIPPVGAVLAPASVVLLGVQSALEDIRDQRGELQAAIEHELTAASPENVLAKVNSALAELRDHITTEEGTAERTFDIAYQRSYERPRIDPPDSYRLTFDLPGPQAVTDADPSHFAGEGLIAVELPRLRRAGGCLTDLGSVLDQTASTTQGVNRGNAMWVRPDRVGGTGRDGAYDDFKNLHDRLCWLLHDTAGELAAAGDHVQLAANALESSDQSADQALRDHAEAVAGVAAPDPTGPPS